jgi:K+-sensing histidine kinase KdpD
LSYYGSISRIHQNPSSKKPGSLDYPTNSRKEKSMSAIVCAVRGGPASRPTIEKSIQMALETQLPLYFLYVVNLDFLVRTSSSRVQLISRQMQDMGEFILLTAQAEAESQGVKAVGTVRHGNIRDEIVALCLETNAKYVVLGKPKTQHEDANIFTHAHLDEFARRIETESGATIIFPDT